MGKVLDSSTWASRTKHARPWLPLASLLPSSEETGQAQPLQSWAQGDFRWKGWWEESLFVCDLVSLGDFVIQLQQYPVQLSRLCPTCILCPAPQQDPASRVQAIAASVGKKVASADWKQEESWVNNGCRWEGKEGDNFEDPAWTPLPPVFWPFKRTLVFVLFAVTDVYRI